MQDLLIRLVLAVDCHVQQYGQTNLTDNFFPDRGRGMREGTSY